MRIDPIKVAAKLVRHSVFLIGLVMFFSCAGRKKKQNKLASNKIDSWVCIYNENASTDDIRTFDLAVLDADAHPDLTLLKSSDTILIGYISLGEVGDYRWYWDAISNEPWILDKNPNWDSYMIDVRARAWHRWVIDEIIPKILAQGFHGLFLDTVDNAEYLEKWHPNVKYPGAQSGMIELIKSIRTAFPEIYIIANRGFSILDQIGPSIDGVVAESVFTSVDFQNDQRMQVRAPHEYNPNIQHLLALKKKFNLAIFTLDYLDPESQSPIRSVLTKARELDFVPYISTPSLDNIYFNTAELK